MKYLLPEWHDLVDRKYDFVEDKKSEEYKKDRFTYGARLWHLLDDVKLDGVLVSRSTISSKILERIEQSGIKSFLGISKNFEVLADCGAWQYVDDPTPRYKPLELLDFYSKAQVDSGVTLDHIAIAAKTREEQENRMKMTYEYALEMFEEWKRKYKEHFNLLGAVQGIEIDDYVNFLEKLYNKGFTAFALGGLARRRSTFIKKLIDQLAIALKGLEIQRLHFLGVARLRIVPYIRKLEDISYEVSADSATILRIAWMRRYTNYLTLDGKVYTAIRVPFNSPNDRELMYTLRGYDEGKVTFKETWQAVKKFVVARGGIESLAYYKALLEDEPWKKCSCKICREIGIDVVIFRGNDRNRRRGFHNVWVFCNLLKNIEHIKEFDLKFKVMKSSLSYALLSVEELSKFNQWLPNKVKQIAILTYCTEQKNVDWSEVDEVLLRYGLSRPAFNIEDEEKYRKIKCIPLIKAEHLYSGTFKVIKRGIEALRRGGVQVDVFFISARYGLVGGDDIVIPYDATLANKPEDWLRAWSLKLSVEEKLREALASKMYDLILVNLTKDYYTVVRETVKEMLQDNRVILMLPKVIADELSKGDVKAQLWGVKGLRERQLRLKHFFEALRAYTDFKRVDLLRWLK